MSWSRPRGTTCTAACSAWPAGCRASHPRSHLARLASRVLIVVEAVNDQENLGAIFRNAAAFGAGAVLLDPTCADPLYRRSVRVSLGDVLRVPFARLLSRGRRPLELSENRGFAPFALTPSPRADRIEVVAARAPRFPVALVVGAEGDGLAHECSVCAGLCGSRWPPAWTRSMWQPLPLWRCTVCGGHL